MSKDVKYENNGMIAYTSIIPSWNNFGIYILKLILTTDSDGSRYFKCVEEIFTGISDIKTKGFKDIVFDVKNMDAEGRSHYFSNHDEMQRYAFSIVFTKLRG